MMYTGQDTVTQDKAHMHTQEGMDRYLRYLRGIYIYLSLYISEERGRCRAWIYAGFKEKGGDGERGGEEEGRGRGRGKDGIAG